MSMQDLTEALSIVNSYPGRGFFAGPRDPELIAAAESVLGVTFPPTYGEFLRRLGAGNFGSFEIYGITNANFDNGKIPNGIWLNVKHRKLSMLPHNLLVIGDTGDGGYYGLDLRGKGEAPVVLFYLRGIADQQPQLEKVAGDFGEFFATRVREQLSLG